MTLVTVSSRFQILIPRRIREQLAVEPGQEFQVLIHDNRIELIPIQRLQSMRGFLRGIDTVVQRERDNE